MHYSGVRMHCNEMGECLIDMDGTVLVQVIQWTEKKPQMDIGMSGGGGWGHWCM